MADEIAAYRGKDAKLYYNSGTRAAPTWVELDCRDLTKQTSWSEGDVSSRLSDYKLFIKTLAELGLDFQMVKYHDDAGYTQMQNMAESATAANEFAVMSGDITVAGSRGVRFFGQVFSDSDSQALEEGQMVDFNVKPTRFYEGSALAPPLPYTVSV